jgi:hypothetical protein
VKNPMKRNVSETQAQNDVKWVDMSGGQGGRVFACPSVCEFVSERKSSSNSGNQISCICKALKAFYQYRIIMVKSSL